MNATRVTLPAPDQSSFSKHLRRTVEKSQTNAIDVTLHNLKLAI